MKENRPLMTNNKDDLQYNAKNGDDSLSNDNLSTQKSKGDRRSRRTAMSLQRSLVDLLLEKSLADITIQELTDRANVSRTTFYLHYQNIGDLFQSIEDEVVAQYEDIINRIVSDEFDILYVGTDKKGQKWLPTLIEAFQFFYDNPKFCSVLLRNPESHFFQRTVERGHDAVLERMEELRPDLTRVELEYFYIFVVNGIRGIVQEWMLHGYKETPNEITSIVSQFVLNHLDILSDDH